MAFPVFFDTNALFGGALNDLFLTLAELGLFRPLWSANVLDELRRNLLANNIDLDAIDHCIRSMSAAFPDAEIRGYEDLIPVMTNQENDRHVLAAAIRADAEVLVTFNLRHFPPAALEIYELEARHPDDFLLDQLGLHEALTLLGVTRVVSSYEHPPMTPDQFLDRLRKAGVPSFADQVARLL